MSKNDNKKKRRSALSDTVAKFARKKVSGTRNRINEDGFDLDLSYIQSNIIAMGLPSEGFESLYRNNIEEVAEFLEEKHAGKYKIWNVSERIYDIKKFGSNVVWYEGWPDHSNPPLSVLFDLVHQFQEWLSKDTKNVVVVHCKAGKGRTGTSICAYLLYIGKFRSVDECLEFFCEKRSSKKNHKDGVRIPSQIRCLKYFNSIITQNHNVEMLKPVKLCELYIYNYTTNMKRLYKSKTLKMQVVKVFKDLRKSIIRRTVLAEVLGGENEDGAVKILKDENGKKVKVLYYKFGELECKEDIQIIGISPKQKKSKIFRLSFHASFSQTGSLKFQKKEIDIAFKRKNIDDNFTCEIIFGDPDTKKSDNGGTHFQ